MFSNSADISHMIQCDMPLSRSTRPMTTATAPIVTAWPSHSQIDSAATENSSMRVEDVEQVELRDQPHRAVDGLEELSMPSCAKDASRRACENSLTVAMLV